MKLIDNASTAWKLFSVQALTVLAALPVVWSQLPPDVQAMLPEKWRLFALTAIALGGLVGRMIDQNGGRA